jgi:hypothetical protein
MAQGPPPTEGLHQQAKKIFFDLFECYADACRPHTNWPAVGSQPQPNIAKARGQGPPPTNWPWGLHIGKSGAGRACSLHFLNVLVSPLICSAVVDKSQIKSQVANLKSLTVKSEIMISKSQIPISKLYSLHQFSNPEFLLLNKSHA